MASLSKLRKFWRSSLRIEWTLPGENASDAGATAYRFDRYEFRTAPASLRCEGQPVELSPQAARCLSVLLENAGEVVTHQQLRERLWPADVHVEAIQGIHFNIRRLRKALGDSARSPRFIETVPTQGYRFVASVDCLPGRALRGRRLEPLSRWGSLRAWSVAALLLWSNAVLLNLLIAGNAHDIAKLAVIESGPWDARRVHASRLEIEHRYFFLLGRGEVDFDVSTHQGVVPVHVQLSRSPFRSWRASVVDSEETTPQARPRRRL